MEQPTSEDIRDTPAFKSAFAAAVKRGIRLGLRPQKMTKQQKLWRDFINGMTDAVLRPAKRARVLERNPEVEAAAEAKRARRRLRACGSSS